MVKTTLTHDRSQAGFTLVELAIVMIIIGLLIGGILKGQELIANAQITATSAQVKAIESAMTTFRDSYSAVPGDMRNPQARLPNCTATPCSNAGNGNNRIDANGTAIAADAAATDGEDSMFFVHLAAADMIGGVDSTSDEIAAWEGRLPSAEVGGGFVATYVSTSPAAAAGTLNPGHYLSLRLNPGALAAGNYALTQTQAARLDRKLDDGVANAGGAQAAGGTTCAGDDGVYLEGDSTVSCGLFMRVQ